MKTAKPRTYMAFGLLFWTLMAFASTNKTQQQPTAGPHFGCMFILRSDQAKQQAMVAAAQEFTVPEIVTTRHVDFTTWFIRAED